MTNFPYETFNELKEALTKKKDFFDDTIPVTQDEMDMYRSYIKGPEGHPEPEEVTFEGFTLVVQ